MQALPSSLSHPLPTASGLGFRFRQPLYVPQRHELLQWPLCPTTYRNKREHPSPWDEGATLSVGCCCYPVSYSDMIQMNMMAVRLTSIGGSKKNILVPWRYPPGSEEKRGFERERACLLA
jgi:hypothetical protein